MYKIVYSRQAERTMLKIPKNVAIKIREKLTKLAVDPFANNNNVVELVGCEAYRLRTGDWRAIYSVYKNQLEILVIKIAPRGGVYK